MTRRRYARVGLGARSWLFTIALSDWHRERRAMERGCDVVTEKPLTIDAALNGGLRVSPARPGVPFTLLRALENA